MKIGLISDTHGFWDNSMLESLEDCDEIWHAGDIGSNGVLQKLFGLNKKIKLVFGNIDGADIRSEYPKDEIFTIGKLKIFMTHIGGYPPNYSKRVREVLDNEQPNLYICGHSHILKIMPDSRRGILHMNPGAAGHHGFHLLRTLITFHILQDKIQDIHVVELGRRGSIKTNIR